MKYKDLPINDSGNKTFECGGYTITISNNIRYEVAVNGDVIKEDTHSFSDEDVLQLRQTMGSGELHLDVNDVPIVVGLKKII